MNCFLEVFTPFVNHCLVLLNFRHRRGLPCYCSTTFDCRVLTVLTLVPRTSSVALSSAAQGLQDQALCSRTGLFGKLSYKSFKSIFVVSLSSQWPVCYSEEMSREKHRCGICCQVHQEAPEPGQPTRGEPGGDRAGGHHSAADPAPQHRQAARHLREQDRRGPHPGAVSKGSSLQGWLRWIETREHCRGCRRTGALINGAVAFSGFTNLGRSTEWGWW